jgi:hypothetical protein
MTRTASLHGYNALFSATNDAGSGVPDAHEGFEFGWEALSAAGAGGEGKKVANVWPEEGSVPGFREAVLTY